MSIKSIIQARSSFDVTNPKVDSLIDLSSTRLSQDAFDDFKTYEYAVALLVMHWLSLGQQSTITNNVGATGGVKSITEGRLSVSFGQVSGNLINTVSPDLQQTSFGIELASLLETVISVPVNRFDE